jgi:gamma-glutamylcyclotransferase (GGCT)/AIG2-like uncharacterized protein YtfP
MKKDSSLPGFVRGNYSIASLKPLQKWWLKKRIKKEDRKCRKKDEYYKSGLLRELLKVIENEELLAEKSVIYNEIHLYKKLMSLKNITETQRENILLGYVWRIDYGEPELLKKDDILEDYQKCCREIAEMFSKRDSVESRIFTAEYLRKIGEFGKAKNILLQQTFFINEIQKTIVQGIIQMCDEQRKESFLVSQGK